MSKLKYLALTILMMLAAPAFAVPAVSTITGQAQYPGVFTQETSLWHLLAGQYDFDAQISSTFTGGGFAGVTISIKDATDAVIGYINGGTTTAQSNFSYSSIINIVTDGDYKMVFEGGSVGGTTVAAGTLQATPVPGPEAGAGLAGLAMAGIGAYAIRRRKQVAA